MSQEPGGPANTGRRRISRVIGMYPVTTIMAAQLLVLYLVPAVLSDSTPLTYTLPVVLRVFAFVFLGTIAVESVIALRKSGKLSDSSPKTAVRSGNERQRPPLLTPVLLAIALAGVLILAWLRVGSFADQLASVQSGGLLVQGAKAAAYVQAAAIAAALLDLANRRNARFAWFALIALIVANTLLGLRIGFLFVVAESLFTIAVAALLLGVIRLRTVAVAFVVILILLPAALQLRNNLRDESTRISASTLNPIDRLRQDTILAQVRIAAPSSTIDLPSIPQAMRYAIPKFLDPQRPVMDVDNQINLAVGGSYVSSNTFTQPGNVFYLYGGWATSAFYAIIAAGVAWLLRRRGNLYLFAVLVAMIESLLYVGGSFPGTIGAFGQSVFFSLTAIWGWSFLSRLFTTDPNKRKRRTIPGAIATPSGSDKQRNPLTR